MEELTLTSERALSVETGVGRSSFKALRDAGEQVAEGPDWVLSGNYVAWTAAGVEKVKGILGIPGKETPPPPPAPADTPPKTAPAPRQDGPETRRFEVSRLVLNKKLVLCYEAGDRNGREHRVRVRSSENFVRGMELEAVLDAGAGCWTMLGRCPRRKGRW